MWAEVQLFRSKPHTLAYLPNIPFEALSWDVLVLDHLLSTSTVGRQPKTIVFYTFLSKCLFFFSLLKLEEKISSREYSALLNWKNSRISCKTDKLYWSAFSYLSSTLSWEEVCYLQLFVDWAIWSYRSQTGNPGGNLSFTTHVQLTDPTVFVINMPFLPRAYNSRWIEMTPSRLLQNKALFTQTQ